MSPLECDRYTKLAQAALERAEKATPGPWEGNGTGVYVAMMSIVDNRIRKYVSAPQSRSMAESQLDIDFIAAARTDLPALAIAMIQLAHDHVEAVGFLKHVSRIAQTLLDHLEDKDDMDTYMKMAVDNLKSALVVAAERVP